MRIFRNSRFDKDTEMPVSQKKSSPKIKVSKYALLLLFEGSYKATNMIDKTPFDKLSHELEGSICTDSLHRKLYATDASVYRKTPLAVAYPSDETDIQKIVSFANKYKIALTTRAAGTSLAGQCVGDGIVIDISKHFQKIGTLDLANKTVTVEPGVIRDDLNRFLKPHGLFFGPNTSTSNRCTIGGMVGNNSSGTTSIQYGVTRDKVLQIKTILSDASMVTFKRVNAQEFRDKTLGDSLENKIYKTVLEELSKTAVQNEIHNEFPNQSIHRRNTGYAVDSLLKFELFGGNEPDSNLCALLCGSEGTLGISTEITLQLDVLPPKNSVLVAAHFTSVQESLEAVVLAMQHNLFTCELMDRIILDCTKNNRAQQKNRFFINGEPEALLLLEVAATSAQEAKRLANLLIEDLQSNNFGYHYPKIYDKDISKIHELRKAGLGLLGNLIGDHKAVACIEDTAVPLKDLPAYIAEFTQMMDDFDQKAVYYAHAGAGEIHLRPILNLKKKADVVLFRKITTKTALLVKKYKGSFSGEHGDGIVRSEFIPTMIGPKNFELLKRIKTIFDPADLFNPGKIVHPLPMDKNLRYVPDRKEPVIPTLMNFDDTQGILKHAEKCNGSGDCRKPVAAGGTMCPSYRATNAEMDSTRARANALREFLTHSTEENKFNHHELHEVFDLCISCKACASECPSSVDVSVLKAEFLHQYYQVNKVPLRTKLFGNNSKYNRYASWVPQLSNALLKTGIAKKILGIAPQRQLPKLAPITLRKWYHKNANRLHKNSNPHGEVVVFCDAFTNHYDVQTGIDCLELLSKIGYKPLIVNHEESGRSAISKGLLNIAKEKARANVATFSKIISKNTPLVGIEPSAILTFRDEYLRLANDSEKAAQISKHTYTIEEFLKQAIEKKHLSPSLCTNDHKTIKIHGHCHQKSLSSMEPTFSILNLPVNFNVTLLNTGCCGMAGSFGYEKEHYKTSMQIGEDSLFPKIRKLGCEVLIAAAGTSCRSQIKDGVARESMHPVSILKEALI
jgi:FAD/FMN-containing dehydrogenase/Fe-S oxidoreductase